MNKTYSPAFKARLVQELVKETKTIVQVAAEHGIHPNVLGCVGYFGHPTQLSLQMG